MGSVFIKSLINIILFSLKKKYVREQVGGKEQAFSTKLKDDMGNEISSKDHGKLYIIS